MESETLPRDTAWAMSDESIDMARRGYEAFNEGDPDGMVSSFAPNFEYLTTGEIPGADAAYRGPEGLREFVGWMWSEFEEPRIEVHELTEVGNQVLAEVTLRGRGKQSGVETSWNIWHLWTARDGEIVRGQAFTSRQEALEAAGLSK
jgi:ketosteroid isomerase-like protein